MIGRTAAWILLVSLASTMHAGLSSAAEPLTEQVRVVVTEVPVHVLRGKEPVRGLTREQFEVYDNGKRQTLIDFEVRDVGAPPAETPPVQAPGSTGIARRHVMLLFDLTFSDAGALLRARRAAAEVVREGLHESDLVAVATFSATRGARLILNFTPDREQVAAAIRTLDAGDEGRRVGDPLALTIVPPDAISAGMELPPDESDPALEHQRIMQVMANKADRRSRQQQVTNFVREMEKLSTLLDSVRGRKDILYLSEGFENSLVFAADDRESVARMNQASERGRVWDVDPNERFGDAPMQAALNSMLDALSRAGCVVHSIDLGHGGERGSPDDGPSTGGRGGGNQVLSFMASETGGTYTRNTTDVGPALDRVLAATSVTYVLVYEPTDQKADGSYHRLKVKLKGAPRGAKVAHRPGYFAPRPYAERSPHERQLQLAGHLLAERSGGAVTTEMLAVPMPSTGKTTHVPVLLEIDGPALLQGTAGEGLPLQVFAYVLDPEGHILDLFTQTVGVRLDAARDVLMQTGLKFYGTFDLEPGRYVLRTLVVNGQTGLSHLNIADLDVPAAGQGPAVLPPLLPDAPGSWLLARREPGEGETAPPFPFMAGDRPFLPSAGPVLERGGTSEWFLMTRSETGEGTAARARFRSSKSDRATDVPLRIGAAAAGGLPGYRVLTANLELPDGLQAGAYRMSVELEDGGTANESADLAVTIRDAGP